MTESVKELRKQREAEQRRISIIKVVRKLIKKGGLGEISLRKVAELAGYSTTVVYSLFEDKAMLISQAMGEDLLELTNAMRRASEAHSMPLDRLRAMARAYVDFGLKHPDEYAFVFMQKRPHAPNEVAHVQHGDPAEDPYAFSRTLFAQWAATGEVSSVDTDVDLMTQIYWEGIHGFTARQLVMGPDDPWFPEVPNERHLTAIIEVLLTGLVRHFAVR
ncbi:MAG: WHG domain-containing protein [Aquabacterium sp.]|uniref:TetR/AcrR family transcriptional regulator n=1 Tax=Aquabacterium sp. TaxID=1872578 RepID=UPI002724A723|nr:WHG domain-containing protein [Aquabacterium sp.]MDO9004812.1 WHG domain-containing protein [Aquabacterium sp.]